MCDKEIIIVDKVGFPTVEDMIDEVGYQYELVLLTPPLHIITIKTRRGLIELCVATNLPQVHKHSNNCVTVHS